MRLHARARSVLLALTEAEHPVKIKQLAERFAVSERTIKYDLEHIRERLAGMEAELRSHTGRGVWLEADAAAKRRLRETVALEESSSVDSARERQNRLALTLLERSGFATLEELAEIVRASRGTVLTDLHKAEEGLRRWNVALERESGKGIRLVGAEADKRLLQQSLAEAALTGSDMLRIVRGIWRGTAWPRDIAGKLEAALLPPADMQRVQAVVGRIVRFWQEKLGAVVQDEAAIGVLFRCAIAVRRLRLGKRLAEETGNGPEPYAVSSDATRRCKELLAETCGELVFGGEGMFPAPDMDAEYVYVLMPLISEAGKNRASDRSERKQRRAELAGFVRGLVRRLCAQTGLPLDRDGELYEGLLAHLVRKADRQRLGVHDTNPLAAEIARTYPELFETVKRACAALQESVPLNESDAASLVLHAQAAVERERETLRFRAVVVCGTGKGTARFLRTLLQNRVRHLEVAECCSVSEAENAVARTSADLAISVLPLELSVPVVKVNPLPTQDDLESIAACLERIATAGREPRDGGSGKDPGAANEAARPLAAPAVADQAAPLPLPELVGRLDPADWPAAEQVCRSLAIRGFELTQAIVGRFKEHLTETAAAGLSLHVTLMVQRLAFGHPYEGGDAGGLAGETSEEAAWRAALKELFERHGLPAAEAEWRAIMRYFEPAEERGTS